MKTIATKRKAARTREEVSASTNYISGVQDPKRHMALTWVKAFIIKGFSPLGIGECEWMKVVWMICGRSDFSIESLHRKGVKQKIVEMYTATTAEVKAELRREIGEGKLLHLNLDLWVDKFSSLKYIGIRVFYVTRKWELRSRLLAVRQFNPDAEKLKSTRLSGILEEYLKTVLSEFQLSVSNLFSATTDSGSDVKRLCDVLLPGLWEWCVCHMLNCALVEATGMQTDPSKSTNDLSRRIISQVKKVVEHVNKSSRSKAIFKEEQVRHFSQCTHRKLVNAAPQRWSGVTNVLEAILINWEVIRTMYDREGKPNPLEGWDQEIIELYSLVKPCAEVITKCQTSNIPTGQLAVFELGLLKLTTLDTDASLEIQTPARKTVPVSGGGTGTSGEEKSEGDTHVEAEKLTLAAKETRKRLHTAVHRRWFDKRYASKDEEKSDLLFDMQLALNPSTADLRYVDKMTDARFPGRAAEIKAKITEKVVDLAVELAASAGDDDDARMREPPPKRTKCTSPDPSDDPPRRSPPRIYSGPSSKKAARERLTRFGFVKEAARILNPTELSLADKARAELERLRTTEQSSLESNIIAEGVLDWWKAWKHSFPILARAARVVYGAPASSAVIERDFSSAGRLMSSKRSRTEPAFVEMILFLHGSADSIPLDVPQLKSEDVESNIPGRLRARNPQLDELVGPVTEFDSSGEDEDDDEEQDMDIDSDEQEQ